MEMCARVVKHAGREKGEGGRNEKGGGNEKGGKTYPPSTAAATHAVGQARRKPAQLSPSAQVHPRGSGPRYLFRSLPLKLGHLALARRRRLACDWAGVMGGMATQVVARRRVAKREEMVERRMF